MNRKVSVAPMMDCTDRHERFFLRLISKNTLLYTEMVAVWDINPCPESLIKKIEKNKKNTDDILENTKQEIANNTIT